jgi:hypothetical protein
MELPKFCPNCGVKLEFEDAKFCPECGFNLTKGTVSTRVTVQKNEANEAELSGSVFDLGNKLEQVVEKILQASGYETERRRKLQGTSGTLSEIDIIGKKTDKTVAVECKNYSEPIGIDEIRSFAYKLKDLGHGWKGIFVAYNGFTDGAAKLAENENIERWDHGEISEKWLALSVGRVASYKGQSVDLKSALPLNINFDQASQINLLNKDKVKVSNVELIYHPYYTIEYIFKALFKDPTRETHKFEDRDTLFVDALDAHILNPMPEKGLGMVKKVLKVIASKSAHAENERNKKLIQELKHNKALGAYSLNIKDDYTVSNLKPVVTPRQATESCIDFIIEKNTTEVTYYPKSKDDEYFQESESVTYIPKRRDISIIRRDIVLVPRWSADFDAFGMSYNKEILGCSGMPLEDTLSLCPKHFKIGAIAIVSKRAIAVCETCGLSLCEDHVKQCPVCNKWLCEEHGVECSECKKRFCKEHIAMICPTCGSPLCDSCATVCPICNKKYGKHHAVSCDQCGTIVCPNCVSTTGLIWKKRTCKKCTPKT